MANLDEAARFLALLDENAVAHTFQTFDDTKERKDPALVAVKHGLFEDHYEILEDMSAKGAGVYVSVQEMDGTGRKASCLKTIRAIFQEDDGDGKDLPLEPHIVVNTSPGKYHRYILVDGLTPSEFNAVMDVVVNQYGGDRNAKDVARVLRLPGFDNYKYGDPYTVTIVHESGQQPYKKEEVLKAFKAKVVKEPDYIPEYDGGILQVTESTVADLRSALNYLDADNTKVWHDTGLALKTIGNVGLDLWVEWGKKSDKWEDSHIEHWRTFKPEKVTYRSVFYDAEDAGWPNPLKNSSPSADPEEDLFADMRAIFASELPKECELPDELVEGLLVRNEISILFGDSNSGKTFFAIDLSCAIALGIDWMGKKTEKGLIVYLASESPNSVKFRLQAYEKYHNISLGDNVLIIQTPVNFYQSEDDVNKLVRLLNKVSQLTGKRIELIVADTLARISAGANESAGEDMGLVMQRFDELKDKIQAHLLIIAHSGKDATKGLRGWSGMRAHVDTEIEVKDKDGVRTATVTKQRGLPGKGDAISFDLTIVKMGVTKWGKDATTCVVSPVDASTVPKKSAYSFETTILLDAWSRDSYAMRNNAPYVNRTSVRASMKANKPEWSPRTMDTKMGLFKKMADKELLEPYEHGWRVIDGMISSQLIVSKAD